MITTYSHSKHFELLKSWYDQRDQLGLETWMLPDLGLVCDNKAIAFLVTTNSPVAWIAHWTVAPSLTKIERDTVFNELTLELEALAQSKGYRLLQTLGKVGHNLSTRLREHNFLEAPGEFTFFVKELKVA
jgi:hypothetical protein